jgi:anti-sigma B factor antagonist
VPAVIHCVERALGDVTILDLHGQLKEDGDIPLVDYIADLLRRERLKVILNLEDVARIDSTGIGIIVAKYLSLRRLGGDLKLLHVNERGRRLLEVTKLSRVLESFESEDEAVRSFAVTRGG